MNLSQNRCVYESTCLQCARTLRLRDKQWERIREQFFKEHLLESRLGRSLGRYLISQVGHVLRISSEDVDRVRAWYVRWGKYTLVLGYFVPGVRHLAALAAGSSRLPLAVFTPFAYFGAMVWSGTFIALGYVLGEEWAHTSAAIHRLLAVGAGIALVTLAILFVFRNKRAHESS